MNLILLRGVGLAKQLMLTDKTTNTTSSQYIFMAMPAAIEVVSL